MNSDEAVVVMFIPVPSLSTPASRSSACPSDTDRCRPRRSERCTCVRASTAAASGPAAASRTGYGGPGLPNTP